MSTIFESVLQVISVGGTVFVPFAMHYLKGIREDAKAWKAEVAEEQRKTNERIAKLWETLDVRLRELEDKKADKQAWMRETINAGAKIDHVSQQISELKGRFDSEFGVAAAVNRLADSLQERAR